MEPSVDYRISKREKGPLQRFKNQNLMVKKFGEMGLQVYRAITGKRTSEQLRKDLDIEPGLFAQILEYMRESGIAEMMPVDLTGEEAVTGEETKGAEKTEEEGGEGAPAETIAPIEEEIAPVEGQGEGEEATGKEAPGEGTEKRKKRGVGEEKPGFEEIRPIDEGEDAAEGGATPEGEEGEGREEAPAETSEPEAPPPEPGAEPEPLAPSEEGIVPEEEKGEGALSPVEKIIKEKYGDVGLKVYTLIDGHRTAEQIMKETGLTESKLVEILDFMDEQGIIKLEYPRGEKKGTEEAAPSMPTAIEKEEFAPMIEKEEAEEELKASGVEVPMKAPTDIVKGVQLKARLMLKLGDKGVKLFDRIDGKRDAIDLAMVTNLPLYEVDRMLKFLIGEHAILIKPMSRMDVKKKYGEDGYAVYKRYVKEGLMLYELIGKEMTIKEMSDRVSTDRAKVAEMFLFIHKVLGIDLPIDKEVLAKQFGLPPG